MDDLASERRKVFSFWLRTGRLPVVRTTAGIELKFNPWHDWVTGRFTFAGSGRRSGGWMDGGFNRDGGGGFGGSGVTGKWESAERRPKTRSPRPATVQPSRSLKPPKTAAETAPSRRLAQLHSPTGLQSPKVDERKPTDQANRQPVVAPRLQRVVRNGYEFRIDQDHRTVSVSGTITLSASPQRSRASQTRAGGADRRGTDDGGHYIAARFNGPTEAFNHFAQDANFNRSGYKVLENEWAAATRSGKQVLVKIVPSYLGASLRPATISVRYTIQGAGNRREFPNERLEIQRGR